MQLTIESVPLSSLKNDPDNARKHNDKNLKAIVGSLEKFGQQKPIVVDKDGFIIAGNGTFEAAKKLKWTHIDIVRSKLDKVTARAYALADNRTSELADWDDEALTLAIKSLHEIDFDLSGIGFDEKFVQGYVRSSAKGKIEDDEVPDVQKNIHNVQQGQIWQLGEHRLMCGDSTDSFDIVKLMDGKTAKLVHTDPPYNVDYSNADRPKPGKKDFGKIRNDGMTTDEFVEFLKKVFGNINQFSDENSSIYIWYASLKSLEFLTALEDSGLVLNQHIIWKKPMLLGRGKYQWAHEPCLFSVKGSPYFTEDRTKTTIWDFGGYDKSKNVHPTQKPIVLCEEAIHNSSQSGDIVLDLFGGSGSTMIACERTGRRNNSMELDEHYCSVIIERWQQFTGNKASLVTKL